MQRALCELSAALTAAAGPRAPPYDMAQAPARPTCIDRANVAGPTVVHKLEIKGAPTPLLQRQMVWR